MNDDYLERVANRKAAMKLAEQQAQSGCPIAGALFGFLHEIRHDSLAAFDDDFYPWLDDDTDDIRPY